MANIWLLAIFIIPTLILIALRVNAIFVYLGLCLGYVLSLYDGGNKFVTKVADTRIIEHLGGTTDIRLMLLLLPAVLITLAMLKTAHGGKYSINIVPALAVGVLAVITVIPLLPLSTAVNVMNGSLWRDVIKYQGALVSISAAAVTILLIVQRSKLTSRSKSSKHHKSKD